MKLKIIFYKVLIVMVLGACEVNKNSPMLRPDNYKFQLSDSTYFSWAWNIHSNKDYYFIGDYENTRVLQLDKKLNLVNSFGKRGKGPSEFLGAGSVFVNKDTLIAYDDGGSRFHYFDVNNGDFITTVNTKPMKMITRFVKNEMGIYFAKHQEYLGISVGNRKGSNNDLFENKEIENLSTDSEILVANLLPYKEDIIITSKEKPLIIRLNKEGNLKKTFNFFKKLNEPELNGLWSQIDESKSKDLKNRNINIFFLDSVIDQSILYILTASWPKNGKAAYILRFKISKDGFKPLPVFRIQGGEKSQNLFQVISVNENQLIGYEGRSNGLFTFNLQQLRDNG